MNSDREKTCLHGGLLARCSKAHEAFQERMSTDDPSQHPRPDYLLAKAPLYNRAKAVLIFATS